MLLEASSRVTTTGMTQSTRYASLCSIHRIFSIFDKSFATQTILLGALPFNSMLAELIQEGVKGVVTLNQDFELFVTPQTYKVK